MQRLLSIGLVAIVLVIILYACGRGGAQDPERSLLAGEITALELKIQAQGGTYNAVGQNINYQYLVTNTGNTVIPGPIAVTDGRGIVVVCPQVTVTGNQDTNLDPGETISCSATYSITQADLNAGAITSNAAASAGATISNTATVTVSITLATVLELTSNATPATYSAAGQVINIAYTIKNTGATPLGPAQFTVNDSILKTINCGAAGTILEAGASLSCAGAYTTAETDRSAAELVFNTVAAGGGATVKAPAQVKVANTAVTVSTPLPQSLTKGSTIKHKVQEGEWMLQIARCYGADFEAVHKANPQVKDPARIWPIEELTIPNIGSNGNIYGPPCIEYVTAQAGDTWETIAQRYNARVDVLKEANPNVAAVTGGVRLRVPRNSAGGQASSGGGGSGSGNVIRLIIIPGANAVPQVGIVTPSEGRDRFVFNGAQGQTLAVKLTAPAGGLETTVTSASGTALKARDANLNWSGLLAMGGDYYIDIFNTTASDKQYTLEAVLTAPTTGTAAERVVDINPGPADGSPSFLTQLNNLLYFRGTGLDNSGAELWKYDAAANSITRVKDIFPGSDGSNPSYLTPFGGFLYFSANGNDNGGVELWRFNGTDAGRLSDIHSGPGSSNPSYLKEFNGQLYFSASSSDGTGVELWRTDGTNVSRVVDIYSGSGDSNPSYLVVYKNALYFSAASNDGFGTELWKWDGANAVRVTDINPGVGNANPSYLTVYKDTLYFSANANDNRGTELWKFDGTNTSLAADINAGAGDSIPSHLAVFNEILYFNANGNNGLGFELWKFDGTNASLASDINKSGDSFPSYLVVYNNHLYFQANGGDNTGRELWRFKGP